MYWTFLVASLAALLASDGGTALAVSPPQKLSIPYLNYFGVDEYEPGYQRLLIWSGSHEMPWEILSACMNPADPSVNEWIACAHYKQLVK